MEPRFDALGVPALLTTSESFTADQLEALNSNAFVPFDHSVTDVRDKLRNVVEPDPVKAQVSSFDSDLIEGDFAQVERATQMGVVVSRLR